MCVCVCCVCTLPEKTPKEQTGVGTGYGWGKETVTFYFLAILICGMFMHFHNRFLKVVLIITSKDKRSHQDRAHSCVNLFPSLDHLAYLKVYEEQKVSKAVPGRRKLRVPRTQRPWQLFGGRKLRSRHDPPEQRKDRIFLPSWPPVSVNPMPQMSLGPI